MYALKIRFLMQINLPLSYIATFSLIKASIRNITNSRILIASPQEVIGSKLISKNSSMGIPKNMILVMMNTKNSHNSRYLFSGSNTGIFSPIWRTQDLFSIFLSEKFAKETKWKKNNETNWRTLLCYLYVRMSWFGGWKL